MLNTSEACFPEEFDEKHVYQELLSWTFKKVSENLNQTYDKITKSNVKNILEDFEYIEDLYYGDADISKISRKMIILEHPNKRLLLSFFENYTKGKDNVYKWNLIKDIQRPLKKIFKSEHIFPDELNTLEYFIEGIQ